MFVIILPINMGEKFDLKTALNVLPIIQDMEKSVTQLMQLSCTTVF